MAMNAIAARRSGIPTPAPIPAATPVETPEGQIFCAVGVDITVMVGVAILPELPEVAAIVPISPFRAALGSILPVGTEKLWVAHKPISHANLIEPHVQTPQCRSLTTHKLAPIHSYISLILEILLRPTCSCILADAILPT